MDSMLSIANYSLCSRIEFLLVCNRLKNKKAIAAVATDVVAAIAVVVDIVVD